MPGPRSLRFHLLRLVLAGLIPTALFAAALMILLWNHQQSELHRSLQDTARAVGLAVDREIETSIKRLEVLSNQDAFLEGRWDEFYRECQRLVATSDDWDNILVLTATGDELLNVRRSGAEPLAQVQALDYIGAAITEGGPVVSDLFVGPTTGQEVVHVAIPVSFEGEELVLAASLNLSGFDRLLADQSIREEGIAVIYDRNLRHVARSRDSERFLGTVANPDFYESAEHHVSGIRRLAMDDSPHVYAAWTRSELTGWTVSVGVPAEPVEASLLRSLLMLTGAGLTVLLATGVVALHLSRRLADMVAHATESAVALAKGEPLPHHEANIIELDMLAGALERTGAALERESKERERAEHERELLFEREQLAREDAEAAGRAKDEFLAMLGHELRNPLAPILFAVELAKSRVDGLPTRELEVIERQAKHIVQLVDDLLDVARIVRGKISLHKQVGELAPIVSKAVEIAAPLLETKQHELELDVPKQGLVVDADETRMAQVIANLLTNAAKFTPRGGRITLTAVREAEEIVIRVRDTGVGIAEELLPQIFDLFTQGSRSADQPLGGLGLGLALVRSFVRLHGGTVAVASEGPGRGSEFTVYLPSADAPELTAEPPPSVAAEPGDDRPPTRVLVVDDNADAAETLARLLALRGYEVRTAHDGRRALEVARDFHPRVAIVDIGMPVMDGYQVAQELTRLSDRPHLIAVTGYGQEHDRERAHAAGFDRHLVKPVAAERLFAYLDEALREPPSRRRRSTLLT
jgi:signal transduction histidine kinase/ActR/RegA family two-component response regulator